MKFNLVSARNDCEGERRHSGLIAVQFIASAAWFAGRASD
jgi:hypothetical protein